MLMVQERKPARRGAAIVEAAVVMVVFFLFLFGILEYGRYLMMRHLVNNAAREGARLAVVNTSGPNANTAYIVAKVKERLGNQVGALGALDVTVERVDPTTGTALTPSDWTQARFGEAIAVRVKGDFYTILPSFLKMDAIMVIDERAMMYSEGD